MAFSYCQNLKPGRSAWFFKGAGVGRQRPGVQLVAVGRCNAGTIRLLFLLQLFPALFIKLALFIYRFYY